MTAAIARVSLVLTIAGAHYLYGQGVFSPVIPKTWDQDALASLEVPLPNPEFSPKAVPADYYYRIPVRPIYRGYPVYAPGKELPGYFEALKQREPEVIWSEGAGVRPRLETKADWLKAGEAVFDAAIFYESVASAAQVRTTEWHARVRPLVNEDGILPFATYVIREKGKVELGNNACGFCHTRVLPNGVVVKGPQGNFPFDRAVAYSLPSQSAEQARRGFRTLFAAPWLKTDPAAGVDALSLDDLVGKFNAIPAGVAARHRASADSPPAIPDLIGVKDRRYLDRTGLVVQRDIGDLMRYAALNNELDFHSNFGGFIPAGRDSRELWEPTHDDVGGRYSDEQLYALGLYLYSLEPPRNPNRPNALTARGERIFLRERCGRCHTPPLYTNNRLIPVDGFTPPFDHERRFDIMSASMDTDPTLTLHTRRGTGYYKVPSLRGVWYRGPFEHNGSVATLEDWFDPQRLRNDYVPTGFRGYRIETRAVRGHRFGLSLSEADKRALIAFLKTL
jgi:hypothetical protein